MSALRPCVPSQAIPFVADLLDEVQCRISQHVTSLALPHFSPLSSTSVVHDNGCGTGAVTEAIAAAKPPAGLRVDATDITPLFVDKYNERARQYGWPGTASIGDTEDLKAFADNTFTHSISAYLFMGLPDHAKAASEIKRVLKDGATAAIIVWEEAAHIAAMIEASKVVRGPDSPTPVPLSCAEFRGAHALKAVLGGGFEKSKVQTVYEDVFMQVENLERWVNIAWTFLGIPPGGWTEKDQAEWGDACKEIVVQLKKVPGARIQGEGIALPMKATILLATK